MSEPESNTETKHCDDSDFVIVDEDGVPIEEEAEGSYVMCMQLQQSGGQLLELDTLSIGSGEGAVQSEGAEATTNAGAVFQEAEEEDEFFERFGTDLDQWFQHADDDEDGKDITRSKEDTTGDDAAPPTQTEAVSSDNEDNELDEDGEDEFAVGMSRTFSDHDADEEWILEKILKRRRAAKKPSEDDDYLYDESGSKASRSAIATKRTTMEYLCKWKWYRRPTWELQSTLEDDGFGPQIQAFDLKQSEQIAHDHQSGAKRVSHPRRGLPKTTNLLAGRSDSDRDTPLSFKDLLGSCMRAVSKAHYDVKFYCDVAQPALMKRFLRQWRSTRGRPRVIFHGTRTCNIPSIVDRGLKVPGSGGIRVANGQVFGRGIYASPSANTALCYAGDYVLVCAGLTGGKTGATSACDGRILVFPKDELVVPLLLLRVEYQYKTSTSSHSPLDIPLPQRLTLAQLHSLIGQTNAFMGQVTPLSDQKEGRSDTITRSVGSKRSTSTDPTAAVMSKVEAAQYARDAGVPHHLIKKGVTKRMIKQGKRTLKEAYAMGLLKAPKS